MRGKPLMSEGIEYHERHSVTSEGRVPARFGKALEIPEDLEPIPPARPTTMDANHPLARFTRITVESTDRFVDIVTPARRELTDVNFVSAEDSVAVKLYPPDPADPFGVYRTEVILDPTLQVTFNEAAIKDENDRRLRKAMECAAMYAAVIEAHKERIEREKAEREAKEAEQAAAAGSPVPEPFPEQTNGDPSQK